MYSCVLLHSLIRPVNVLKACRVPGPVLLGGAKRVGRADAMELAGQWAR